MTTDGGTIRGEAKKGIMSAKHQSYITTASAMEGVLHTRTLIDADLKMYRGVRVCV